MKIIMPAKDIPLNSRISKIGGNNVYILSDSITIYNINGEKNIVRAENNSFFLINDNSSKSSISSIGGDTELVWLAETNDLLNYLGAEITWDSK